MQGSQIVLHLRPNCLELCRMSLLLILHGAFLVCEGLKAHKSPPGPAPGTLREVAHELPPRLARVLSASGLNCDVCHLRV